MNTKYTCTGEVHQIGNTQTWPSGFSKRTLVLKTASGKYDNYAAFEFTRDRTGDLDKVRVGDTVEVEFYIDANESKKSPGVWFSANKAVKLAKVGAAGVDIALSVAAAAKKDDGAACDDDGDMPF